ncbi:MAG: protein kinase [Gammaproteobacteria bacterium]|nr:protein kinase [Gammaproteobacteria bacterium]
MPFEVKPSAELSYPQPHSRRYRVEKNINVTPNEFAAAEAYFKIHPSEFKLTCTTANAVNQYTYTLPSTKKKLSLDYALTVFQGKIFLAYTEEGRKKLLPADEKPSGVSEERWAQHWEIGIHYLSDRLNLSKLLKNEKVFKEITFQNNDGHEETVILRHSFYNISHTNTPLIYAAMSPRTLLAQGGFSIVKLLKGKAGDHIAVKKCWLEYGKHNVLDALKKEHHFLERTQLSLFFMLSREKNKSYFFMPYFPLDLESVYEQIIIKNIFPKQMVAYMLEIFIQVTKNIRKIHSLNIIHRDIKPANILLDENNTPTIADYGMAMMNSEKELLVNTKACGTMNYIAPEIYNPNDKNIPVKSNPQYSFASDIFALGETIADFHSLIPTCFAHEKSKLLLLIRAMKDPNPVNRPLYNIIIYCLAYVAAKINLFVPASSVSRSAVHTALNNNRHNALPNFFERFDINFSSAEKEKNAYIANEKFSEFMLDEKTVLDFSQKLSRLDFNHQSDFEFIASSAYTRALILKIPDSTPRNAINIIKNAIIAYKEVKKNITYFSSPLFLINMNTEGKIKKAEAEVTLKTITDYFDEEDCFAPENLEKFNSEMLEKISGSFGQAAQIHP